MGKTLLVIVFAAATASAAPPPAAFKPTPAVEPLRTPPAMRSEILAQQPAILRNLKDLERQMSRAERVAASPLAREIAERGRPSVVRVQLAFVRVQLAVLDYIQAVADVYVPRVGLLEDDPADKTEEISDRAQTLKIRVNAARPTLQKLAASLARGLKARGG